MKATGRYGHSAFLKLSNKAKFSQKSSTKPTSGLIPRGDKENTIQLKVNTDIINHVLLLEAFPLPQASTEPSTEQPRRGSEKQRSSAEVKGQPEGGRGALLGLSGWRQMS